MARTSRGQYLIRQQQAPTLAARLVRLHWFAYVALLVMLCTIYTVMVKWGAGLGFDFADFRAAAVVLAHGGNPYDRAQLWRVEDALYNRPLHLQTLDFRYYHFDPYHNPPLFAALLTPLTHLPYLWSYALYSLVVVALGVLGAWLTLVALDWTRARWLAIGLALLTTPVFLTLWFGQQSTLLLCALAGTMLCLRHRRHGVAGGLMALGLVKPHLMLPVALVIPILLATMAERRRYLVGLAGTLGALMLATLLLTGSHSLLSWSHDLLQLSNTVEADQSNLPSLGGLVLLILPHPWNRYVAVLMIGVALALMVVLAGRVRARGTFPWLVIPVLMAIWIVTAPYVHTTDQVLILPALALLWRACGAHRVATPATPRLLSVLALWAYTVLPLCYVVAPPWRYLDLVPIPLILLALWVDRRTALSSSRRWAAADAPEPLAETA